VDRDQFEQHLTSAVGEAYRIAAGMLIDDLPEPITLRVLLNHSYGSPEPPAVEEDRSPAEAADLLWRDGLAPRWVNVAVRDETGSVTIVELLCSGDYLPADRNPFVACSPNLPPSGETPFSLHHHLVVADEASLRRLGEVAHRVRYLKIATDLPVDVPPGVEYLWDQRMASTPAEGPPGLRWLTLTAAADFAVTADRVLPHLERLEIEKLPDRAWGMNLLRAVTPQLTELALFAPAGFWADGPLPAGTRHVKISGERLVGSLELPPALESLNLHFTEGLDDLARVEGDQRIEYVSLRDTPVTEPLAAEAVRRWRPRRLNLSGCGLDEAALIRIAMLGPGMELLPTTGVHGPAALTGYENVVIRLPGSDAPAP
jgi:hypothetical protein